MTAHNIAELFGITAETIGQEIVVEAHGVGYEGTLTAIDGALITLEDCYPTTSSNSTKLAHGRHSITLTADCRVWLDLHEDDFVTDETGAVTLPYDSTISES